MAIAQKYQYQDTIGIDPGTGRVGNKFEDYWTNVSNMESLYQTHAHVHFISKSKACVISGRVDTFAHATCKVRVQTLLWHACRCALVYSRQICLKQSVITKHCAKELAYLYKVLNIPKLCPVFPSFWVSGVGRLARVYISELMQQQHVLSWDHI